jgi:RND family efflux transporter MFP subunit
VAPFAGIISEVLAETGQYVRVGDPLLRITNMTHVELPVPIKLSDYAKLAPLLRNGEFPPVRLARDVSATAEWTGRLTRTAPKADEQNRTIQVFVEVDNQEQPMPLLPGTFVHARIEGPLLENVFAIPRDAIIKNHVLIAKVEGDSPVLQKRIEPIETLQNLAILYSGLDEGDQLILTNLDVLYREPSAKIPPQDARKQVLSINRRHDLPEFLENQRQALVTILDCSENSQP